MAADMDGAAMDELDDAEEMDEAEEQNDGGWKRGVFQLLFLSVGQGDCCIITCPNGDHIMIDCGSKARERDDDGRNSLEEILRHLWSKDVFGRPNTQAGQFTALILTHCDVDHINQLRPVIGGATANKVTYPPIPIDKLYFSGTSKDMINSPIEIYAPQSQTLYASVRQAIYSVTLNATTKTLGKWEPPFKKAQHTATAIATDRVTVLDGTLAGGTTWEVSIIAGNVAKLHGDMSSGDANAASLVTLVRIGTERVLICGDATSSTETYLYNTFNKKGVIETVDLLQAPHHGSSVTSSTANFVGMVKPRMVVFSVQSQEHSHHLPGYSVVDAYIAHAGKDHRHASAGWKSASQKELIALSTSWEGGAVKFVAERARDRDVYRYYRSGVNIDTDGAVMLDGVRDATGHYVLYQRPLEKAVRQTGIDQHQWYYFP